MSDSISSTIKSLLELLPSRTKGPGLIISLTSMIVVALLTKPMLPALTRSKSVRLGLRFDYFNHDVWSIPDMDFFASRRW